MLRQNETLSEKFVNRGSWIFLFTLLVAPLGYFVRIMLASDLSVSEVGVLYGIIGLLTLLQVYSDFGITESLNYFLPKYIIEKDYGRCKYLLVFSFCIQMITSVILGIFLFFMADFLSVWQFKTPIAKEVMQIMSLFFVGLNLMQISTILFSASQNTKFQKGMDFFRMVMTVLGTAGLFFLHQGNIITYAWVWIGSIFITVIFAFFLSYFYYYRPYFQGVSMKSDRTLLKTFMNYSLGTFLTANVATLLHQLDQQILQNLTTSTEGGIYAMYLSLVGIPFIFISPLISFIFPVISEARSRSQNEKIRTIHTLFSSTMAVVILWASGLFCILGVFIAVFLYGKEYAPSGIALYYVAPFLFLNVLIQINFQIMAGVGMIRERVWIFIKTLLFNVVFMTSMILSFKYHFLSFPSASSAASFSVGVSWILMWFLSYRAVHEFRGKMDWIFFMKNLIVVILGILFFFIFHLSSFLPTFGMSGKMAAISEILFVFLGTIAIFLLLNFQKGKEFLFIIREARKRK